MGHKSHGIYQIARASPNPTRPNARAGAISLFEPEDGLEFEPEDGLEDEPEDEPEFEAGLEAVRAR